jgi:hypothetical protein
MAVHAGLCGRDRRVGGQLDAGVAIAAVKSEVPGVQLMAVRDRLHGLVACVGPIGMKEIR